MPLLPAKKNRGITSEWKKTHVPSNESGDCKKYENVTKLLSMLRAIRLAEKHIFHIIIYS